VRYWCALTSPTQASRFALYRTTTSPCDSSGKLYVDSLSSSSVFTYTASVASTSLATVGVDLTVNTRTSGTTDAYRLNDTLVLRNSTRS